MGQRRRKQGLQYGFSCTTVQRGVMGAVPCESVGPKIATTGSPTAAATCIAPESLPTNNWQRERSAGRSAIAVAPTKLIDGPSMPTVIASETVRSAAVPKRITSASLCRRKRFTKSANRSGGQHLADPYDAPAPIAIRLVAARAPAERRIPSARAQFSAETCKPTNDSLGNDSIQSTRRN